MTSKKSKWFLIKENRYGEYTDINQETPWNF